MSKTGAFYARVSGRVQGVGFRYSTIMEARRLGVNGWVRNAADGDVEVWAEGSQENLAQLLSWLHRGPQFARVDLVEAEDKTPHGYRGFDVEH
jgi:acylphosphatase